MGIRLRYSELAPQGIAAMRSLEHYLNTATSLSPVLLEMVRLRASLLNGCEFCKNTHSSELLKHNEPRSRIDAVACWQESDAFTPRERAALAWSDSVTNLQQTHIPDEDFAAVNHFFKDKELADLTLAIASINAWNRLGVAFRPDWNPAKHREKQVAVSGETRSAVGDDGGKVAED